ncbi:MAG: phasin family protein [Pseudomonadota bacterium]
MALEDIYSKTAESARARAEDVLNTAQSTVKKASDWVEGGKKPVQQMADASLKLSSISHQTTDKLVRAQARAIENEVLALSEYLSDVADADSVQTLARRQIEILPRLTRRVVDNTRETITILRDAGTDVRGLIGDTIGDIRESSLAKTTRKAAAKAKSTVSKAKAKVEKDIKAA